MAAVKSRVSRWWIIWNIPLTPGSELAQKKGMHSDFSSQQHMCLGDNCLAPRVSAESAAFHPESATQKGGAKILKAGSAMK